MLKSRFSIVAVFLLALSLPACIVTTDDDGLLQVINDSSVVIEELRVAGIGSRFYGPDLTGGQDLFPGESLRVRLDCDVYDVLFVDALGLECEVLNLDVCVSRTVFVIDDLLLSRCALPAKGT